MPPRRGKIKRTKTFTGCSACRSRGVKCGEEKPTCLRCRKMSLHCGGYGVTLVWPGSKEPKTCQRRVILTGRESSVQAMRGEEILSILSSLDTVAPSACISIGLFGVFPSSTQKETDGNLEPSFENQTRSSFSSETFANSYGVDGSVLETERIRRKNRSAVLRLGCRPEPFYDSLALPCTEGRELMHYWITHLGPLMLPTERLDNPFISIIVPLALPAHANQRESSGRKALLHSVYSLSAFSRWACSSLSEFSKQYHHALGSKHLFLAFKQLGRSLVKANHEKPEAVLATILLLAIIGIFTDNYSNYRVHIRGGVDWIESIDKTTWECNRDASVIYQIFTAIEALRPAHSLLARDLEPQELPLENLSLASAHSSQTFHKDTGFSLTSVEPVSEISFYCLDKFFSLPKPILECIMQINRLIFEDNEPVDDEIVALEFKIMVNNPQSFRFPSLTPASEKVSHHHACILYCAMYIYYKCSLLKLPPSNVQWLVRQNIKHLDAIESLGANVKCSGFLWPLFITGCEADEKDLREKIAEYFDKRETLGIANVAAARRVVDEVWRRRDNGILDVSWHEVMAELGIDILLG